MCVVCGLLFDVAVIGAGVVVGGGGWRVDVDCYVLTADVDDVVGSVCGCRVLVVVCCDCC